MKQSETMTDDGLFEWIDIHMGRSWFARVKMESYPKGANLAIYTLKNKGTLLVFMVL